MHSRDDFHMVWEFPCSVPFGLMERLARAGRIGGFDWDDESVRSGTVFVTLRIHALREAIYLEADQTPGLMPRPSAWLDPTFNLSANDWTVAPETMQELVDAAASNQKADLVETWRWIRPHLAGLSTLRYTSGAESRES